MSRRFWFHLLATPVAQPRPRAVRMGLSGTRIITAASKHPINAFKAAIRSEVIGRFQGPVLTGPLGMELDFVMPRPKAMMWKTKPTPRQWYSAKTNDWDNLGKGLCDALNLAQVRFRAFRSTLYREFCEIESMTTGRAGGLTW